MKIGVIILIIIVLLAVWFGSTFVGHRNEMVRKREAINSAWAQVDVVLQRRADLIPNLVETVKGVAGQEQKVFGDIERRRYNDAIQDYNTYIGLFPNNIVASLSGFTRNDAYFKAEEGSRTAPKVNFPTPTPQPAPAPTK